MRFGWNSPSRECSRRSLAIFPLGLVLLVTGVTSGGLPLASAQQDNGSDTAPHVRRKSIPGAQELESDRSPPPALPELPSLTSPLPDQPSESMFGNSEQSEKAVIRAAPGTRPSVPRRQPGSFSQKVTVKQKASSVQPPLAAPPILKSTTPIRIESSATKPDESQLRLTTSPLGLPSSRPAEPLRELDARASSSLLADHRLTTRSPQVRVWLDGPENVVLGAPQPYTVVVENAEQVGFSGLVVQIEIPKGVEAKALSPTHGRCEIEQTQDGLGCILWAIEKVDERNQATLPLEVVATTTDDFQLGVQWTFQSFAATTPVRVMAPKIELSLDGPREATFGQPAAYRLSIRNPGTADASNVTVTLSAEQYGSNSTVINRIASGGEETMDVELVFNQPGAITVAAEASTLGLISSSEVHVMVRQAQLDIAVNLAEHAFHGAPIPLVLQMRNSGDAPCRNIQSTIKIPSDAKLISVPSSVIRKDDRLEWNVAELLPGKQAEITVELSLVREGQHEILVESSSESGETRSASAMVNVQTVTDLKLLVNEPVSPAPVGGEVAYELTLVNEGSKLAEEVSVVALFSKDIEPVRAEGHVSRIFPGQVQFDPIPRIQPGETVKLRVYAVADVSGMHRFRVEVNALDSEIKLVQEETTQYMQSSGRSVPSGTSSARR